MRVPRIRLGTQGAPEVPRLQIPDFPGAGRVLSEPPYHRPDAQPSGAVRVATVLTPLH